ncbi:MAG: acetate/propionate family kinase [Microbacterium gubbeenense]|uniref:acetate/propionate family kinase n=1 Tax=Microbacterium gubbeenense TaxID=159896 RepID=UPI003F9B4A6B
MAVVLVVNSGSSSFKYQLIEIDGEEVLASGLVERIGEERGRAEHVTAGGTTETTAEIRDHTAGFGVMLEAFAAHGPSLEEHPPTAVGHRVVHGGARFFEATVITPLVEINIDELAVLAPLHNPGALQGIRAARAAFESIPHVAVFDTAFHQSMPPEAYTYALDRETADKHRIRRYGFHGTSHKFVSEAAAAHLERPLTGLKQIVFHLGNGASVTAIDGGRSVETSMGFTPLEGLVMGTRTGDLDPAILLHLQRRAQLSTDEIDDLLNKKSGLVGLAGANDMRDLTSRAEAGDDRAQLAIDVYTHRLRAYAGAYLAQLGGADVVSFTAGIGENVAHIRASALRGLEFAGVRVDPDRNSSVRRGAITRISTDDSRVAVLVVPTDEEVEIARQTLAVASARVP